MCLSPITIDNPYFRLGGKGINFLKNTVDSKITVPCGQCAQCTSLRQAWYNQRIQMESFRSHLYYFTLTYNESSICRTHIYDYNIPYPNYKDVQDCFKRLRHKLHFPIRYFIVSEYGSKRKRPHYHGIIAVDKFYVNEFFFGCVFNCEKFLFNALLSEWKRNYGSRGRPYYKPLLDYKCVKTRQGWKYTYDLHYIVPISGHDNDVSFYVTKYILKFDERTDKLLKKIKLDKRLNDKQTKTLLSLIKPRAIMSKDFGDWKDPAVSAYITDCINEVPLDIPQFFDINTGQRSMLSRYYRKHLYKLSAFYKRFEDVQRHPDALAYSFNPEVRNLDTVLDFSIDAEHALYLDAHFKRVKHYLSEKHLDL